jgi:hypothetical protein
MDNNRRKYPRVRAPVYYRPAGLRILNATQEALNISLGGVRVFSDDELKIGTPLSMDLFLPDGVSINAKCEVVWIDPLPAGSPGRFEVGLRFTEMDSTDCARLSRILEPAEE